MVDRGDILQIKIPSPLPLAWGRTVAPFVPVGISRVPRAPPADVAAEEAVEEAAEEPAGSLVEVASMGGSHLTSQLKQSFQVYMNAPSHTRKRYHSVHYQGSMHSM